MCRWLSTLTWSQFTLGERPAARPLTQHNRLSGPGRLLAIHVFLEGLVSIGKAAELAGTPRIDFEWLVAEMGLPIVRYDVADAEQDLKTLTEAERQRGAA